MNRFALTATVLLMFTALPAIAADTWTGRCIGVIDGDTIRVLRGTGPVKIRLYGIDCPERYQPFSSRARQFTAGLVLRKTVTGEKVDTDPHGRRVALVFVDGVNVNYELVKAGFAWWYRKHAPNNREFRRLESEARMERRGLWRDPSPVPPWKWRKSHR